MFKYSEAEMSEAFEKALKKNMIKSIPEFSELFSELVCHQGIADFVGIPPHSFSFKDLIDDEQKNKFNFLESSSQILSLLKYKSGRTKEYLLIKSSLRENSFNKTVLELEKLGLVIKIENLYYLSYNWKLEKSNIWAFELKLSNWKRAIFQAQQYKAFSSYSIIVYPLEKERTIQKNKAFFQKFNIGLLLFSPETFESKWMIHPKKEIPISKGQTLYLLEKIYNLSNS